MSASDVATVVTLLSSALRTSINTPLPLKIYTSAIEKPVNWVTLVSLLVEYLLYSVTRTEQLQRSQFKQLKQHPGVVLRHNQNTASHVKPDKQFFFAFNALLDDC